jgi:hypothetical protein
LYLSDGTVQKITIKRSPTGDTFTSAPFARFGCPTRLVARDENGAIIGNREDKVC